MFMVPQLICFCLLSVELFVSREVLQTQSWIYGLRTVYIYHHVYMYVCIIMYLCIMYFFQVKFCKRNPGFMDSVRLGAVRAIDECQYQVSSTLLFLPCITMMRW